MSAELLNPPTPTFRHLGEPSWWTCPHCAAHVLLYPALGNNHRCPNYSPNVSVRVFHYYYELGADDRIRALVLVGAVEGDPLLRVTTLDRDGRLVEWERRAAGDGLRFYPADPDRAADCQLWYDDRIQRHEPIPRRELERRALRGRHTA